ncbi:class I SAM-dependent methyltransferase [Candidatus Saccharibacteria bacterium]|nr:class I SAM-dependent methyltransferase [Candidatus Saccharibacteria bacterium]
MATQNEIERTYDYMDDIFRVSLGDHADITGAMYNGDFSLTLDQAQQKKHDFILDSIKLKPGSKIMDIGCGWGPVLYEAAKHGGKGIGFTLSPAQARACKADGLNVLVKDWKDVDPKDVGKVDGVVSVGAFEHFCSIDEYKAGKQEEIYRDFFKLCSDSLDKGGKLYLQTMLWGKSVPNVNDIDVNAKKLSDSWILGHIEKFYPGSWLPSNIGQIEKCAKPYFKLVSENNGRLDYIQTMKEWGRAWKKPSLRKFIFMVKLAPRYARDKDFRYQITSLRYGCNRLCFEREIMTHQRMVFEKVK